MRCDECGYDYSSVPRGEVAGRLRSSGTPFAVVLRSAPSGPALRRRPAPEVWSALEYACHMRDVFLVQRERVALALSTDRPTFEPMRRDERAVELRYNEQPPLTVAAEVEDAAAALADAFAALSDEQWERTGMYSYPSPTERTLEWVGRHTIHEAVHHLQDVQRSLNAG